MSETQVWFITGAGAREGADPKGAGRRLRELSSSLAHDTPAPEYA